MRTIHLLWDGELSCERGAWTRGTVFASAGDVWLDAAVKQRGETSCGAPKPSLKVRFPRCAPFEGRREINLLAGWQDRSLLREKLAWDLFRDAGVPCCRAEMAAVHGRDGDLLGLYVLVDEPAETLGTTLSLPPWLEGERATLERELTPIA